MPVCRRPAVGGVSEGGSHRVLTLILGGRASGKSAFAEQLAAETGGAVLYLATGIASDAEMEARIEAHRRRRPAGWQVVEAPLELVASIPGRPSLVVLESVDTWLGNLMEQAGGGGAAWDGPVGAGVLARCRRELEVLNARTEQLIAVSSELGLSAVPLTAYGRAHGQLLGELNQALAAQAGRAYLVVAGLALPLPIPGGGPER